MAQSLVAPRILIVDDVSENIDILGALLSDYTRMAALDGPRALELAASPDRRPDLVLLDVMMPGMDGFEVCRRLKDDPATRDIPVIFVTTLDGPGEQAQGFELGAVDYVTKPFEPAVVRARVRTHLELKASRDALRDQNVLLEQRVQDRTQQLRQALDRVNAASLETIVRLSRAAEYKDDDTGSHVLRIAHVTATVARAMQLPDEQVQTLLRASPMHDVGKIGVPDAILLKPGRLTDDEWVVMRQHCAIGGNILAGADTEVMRLAEVVARTHHERWDGSGYPQGLRGEEIPLAGRIVAIADVFDALMSRRPYKQPFPLDKSEAILRESSGTHFDPQVVEAFFRVEAEVLEIRQRFADEPRPE